MTSILALCGLTIKESIRRKVFLAMAVIVAVALISLSIILPAAEPQDRVRLAQAWTLRIISTFAILLVICLVATTLPLEVETRSVLNVMSKPIPRSYLLAGRLLGYLCVLAIFVLLSGLVAMLTIRIIATTTLPEGSQAASCRQRFLPQKLDFLTKAKPHSRSIGTLYSHGKPPRIGIGGGRENAAIAWTFSGLNQDELPEMIDAEIFIRPESIRQLGKSADIEIAIRPFEWDRETMGPPPVVRYLETIYYKARHHMKIPRKCLDRTGSLIIRFRPLDPESYIGASTQTICLYSRWQPFEYTYLLALLLIFLQCAILSSLCLLGSTLLSPLVSLLFGVFMWFSGSVVRFVEQNISSLERAARFSETILHSHHHGPPPFITPWLAKFSLFVLHIVMVVFPDFSVFDATRNLVRQMALPPDHLSLALKTAAIYVLIPFALSCILLRIREFK